LIQWTDLRTPLAESLNIRYGTYVTMIADDQLNALTITLTIKGNQLIYVEKSIFKYICQMKSKTI